MKPFKKQRIPSRNVTSSAVTVNTGSIVSLPGYVVQHTPHLRDYLGDSLQAYTSPLLSKRLRKGFVDPDEVVLRSVVTSPESSVPVQAFTRAGPREIIYFPAGVRAAIVSCGGICPGINTVIGELTQCLHQYNVSAVFGVQHGYVRNTTHLYVDFAHHSTKHSPTMSD